MIEILRLPKTRESVNLEIWLSRKKRRILCKKLSKIRKMAPRWLRRLKYKLFITDHSCKPFHIQQIKREQTFQGTQAQTNKARSLQCQLLMITTLQLRIIIEISKLTKWEWHKVVLINRKIIMLGTIWGIRARWMEVRVNKTKTFKTVWTWQSPTAITPILTDHHNTQRIKWLEDIQVQVLEPQVVSDSKSSTTAQTQTAPTYTSLLTTIQTQLGEPSKWTPQKELKTIRFSKVNSTREMPSLLVSTKIKYKWEILSSLEQLYILPLSRQIIWWWILYIVVKLIRSLHKTWIVRFSRWRIIWRMAQFLLQVNKIEMIQIRVTGRTSQLKTLQRSTISSIKEEALISLETFNISRW